MQPIWLNEYNKVEELDFISFNVIAATFYEHFEILNFYNNRSTNAMAESFNAKIKLFRANLEVLRIRNSSFPHHKFIWLSPLKIY